MIEQTYIEGKDYKILHSGSTWAGEPNRQNTIEELINLSKEYHFEDFTSCHKSPLGWRFFGNFREYSNCFNVDIFNVKLAHKLQRLIKARITL